MQPGEHCFDWNELATQNFEMAEECLKINYFGAKRMVEAHISLLQLSDSARIVNVSSLSGLLKNVENEYAKAVLNDVENLTEEKIDELLNKFMKDFKEGSLEKEGWRTYLSAYTVSKAALNAYTRLLAKKYPDFLVNSVCPGYVKTDINCNTGFFTPSEGAQSAVRLALLPQSGPSGLFFSRNEMSCF
ncbi:hypothetical protein Ddye_017859 [Dipteronia dyeriana]|uniref:(+)-neomenthol dehydrogenase-like n=1 Tax=Dipteronia dyeriana TaxID=168575 RepID=A0AAD9X1S1_9ROSI|nr:hypothetical protein Ddye_017859 [Dipteronia dyeriana]